MELDIISLKRYFDDAPIIVGDYIYNLGYIPDALWRVAIVSMRNTTTVTVCVTQNFWRNTAANAVVWVGDGRT